MELCIFPGVMMEKFMFVARDFSAVWFFSAEVERKRERERGY